MAFPTNSKLELKTNIIFLWTNLLLLLSPIHQKLRIGLSTSVESLNSETPFCHSSCCLGSYYYIRIFERGFFNFVRLCQIEFQLPKINILGKWAASPPMLHHWWPRRLWRIPLRLTWRQVLMSKFSVEFASNPTVKSLDFTPNFFFFYSRSISISVAVILDLLNSAVYVKTCLLILHFHVNVIVINLL